MPSTIPIPGIVDDVTQITKCADGGLPFVLFRDPDCNDIYHSGQIVLITFVQYYQHKPPLFMLVDNSVHDGILSERGIYLRAGQ